MSWLGVVLQHTLVYFFFLLGPHKDPTRGDLGTAPGHWIILDKKKEIDIFARLPRAKNISSAEKRAVIAFLFVVTSNL